MTANALTLYSAADLARHFAGGRKKKSSRKKAVRRRKHKRGHADSFLAEFTADGARKKHRKNPKRVAAGKKAWRKRVRAGTATLPGVRKHSVAKKGARRHHAADHAKKGARTSTRWSTIEKIAIAWAKREGLLPVGAQPSKPEMTEIMRMKKDYEQAAKIAKELLNERIREKEAELREASRKAREDLHVKVRAAERQFVREKLGDLARGHKKRHAAKRRRPKTRRAATKTRRRGPKMTAATKKLLRALRG